MIKLQALCAELITQLSYQAVTGLSETITKMDLENIKSRQQTEESFLFTGRD